MGTDPDDALAALHRAADAALAGHPSGRKAAAEGLQDLDGHEGVVDPGASDAQRISDPLVVLAIVVPLFAVGEMYRFLGRGLGAAGPTLLIEPLAGRLSHLAGLGLPIAAIIALILGLLIWQVVSRRPWAWPRPALIAVSVLWAMAWVSVRLMIGLAVRHLSPDQVLGSAGLAMSGSVEEELIFRCCILGGLVLCGRLLELPRTVVVLFALPISAAFFSLAHTTIVNHFMAAEPFQWSTFWERTLSGVLYGAVYLRQGLGVATLSHGGYNLAQLALVGVV